MSYIRATSNPEGLYIIGTRTERGSAINIMCGNLSLCMPPHVFHGVLRRWKDVCYCGDTAKYRGAALHQITRKELGLKESKKWWKERLDARTLQWRLTYERWTPGQYVDAWLVTWMYVARDLEDRSKS
jgi:hypothetical protein